MHNGVNPYSLIRAFYQSYILKERRIGGSTISMQLARMHYGIDSRSIPGKIRQIFSALYLDFFYSKQDILEAYVNLAPCGGNIQGFPAAALLYFGRNLQDLSLGESLLLCVLPQDPLGRYPRKSSNLEELVNARETLYERWKTKYPLNPAKIYHPRLLPGILSKPDNHAIHFTEMLQLENRNWGSFQSSLNYDLQLKIEDRLSHYVDRMAEQGVYNASALILDSRTMEVQALVGSADFFDSGIMGMVNGCSARRSPGSTLKPFVYALALDQGLIHSESILFDRPISFSSYSPDNYKRDFKGPVSAWNALVNSRNIPAVELTSLLDKNDSLYDLLHKADVGNLKEESHYGLSIVLGSAELSMLELSALYGAFLNKGALQDIMASEDVILQDVQEQNLFSEEAARIVLSMLKRNPPPGEGFRTEALNEEEIPYRLAYKTGTSIGFKDAWSIGMYGPYVMAVWIGNFSGEGNPAFLGREMATPLLFEMAKTLENEIGEAGFDNQNISGIRDVPVCAVSGKIPGEYCPSEISALFIPGRSPIQKCDIHRPIIIDSESGLRLSRERDSSQIVVREVWPSDMLQLFQEAGLPRPIPPPYESQVSTVSSQGRTKAPRIVSPLQGSDYILRAGDDKYGHIPLSASADGEVKEIFWFVNGTFYAKSEAKKTVYWQPSPGQYQIILLDDKGFSVDREVSVLMEP